MTQGTKKQCDDGYCNQPATYYVPPFYLCIDHYYEYLDRKRRLDHNRRRAE